MTAVLGWLLSTQTGRLVASLVGGAALCVAAYLGFTLWLAAHDASIRREMTAKCAAEEAQMVSEAEHAAVAAQLAEERRQRELASQITEDARKRAEAAVRARDKARADLEARIAADTADGCSWNEDDEKWRAR